MQNMEDRKNGKGIGGPEDSRVRMVKNKTKNNLIRTVKTERPRESKKKRRQEKQIQDRIDRSV